MPILDTLRKDMFEARKSGDQDKANILSIAIAAVSNYKIDVQRDITDEDVVIVLRKEEKKLKEALDQFTNNGRDDLAQREKIQLEVIQKYLPALMSDEEVEKIVRNQIAQLGDVTIRDMGKIMGMVMAQLKGRADGNVVSQMVKKVLTSN